MHSFLLNNDKTNNEWRLNWAESDVLCEKRIEEASFDDFHKDIRQPLILIYSISYDVSQYINNRQILLKLTVL